jgi:hypothetical protein
MIQLSDLYDRLGDDDRARTLFRQAVEARDANQSADAFCQLADLLAGRGDITGARTAWQQAIESGTAPWAEDAFLDLCNQLSEAKDVDGARIAHRLGVETGNPEAPYALVVIGKILRKQGDLDGWRAAWEQAIDTGYDDADELRAMLSPASRHDEVDDGELADLPAEFDPRNMARTGSNVLLGGLPALPGTLSYQMAIPMAYWSTPPHATVLFLRYRRQGADRSPVAVMGRFLKENGQWKADSHWVSTGFSHDPIAEPRYVRYLDGRAIVVSGGSRKRAASPGQLAAVSHGLAAPSAKQIAVIQNGNEDRRSLDSHFGAWIVCTEHLSPFQVTALGSDGSLLDTIHE